MGSLNPFSKPKIPAMPTFTPPPPPAPVPTQDTSAEDLAAARADDREKRKTQKGRAATVLSGNDGIMNDDTSGVATKKLLGG